MSKPATSRLTDAGLAFLAASIVIGMAGGGADTYVVVAGIAMLVLLAVGYFSKAR